jgi:hypothetical protein
MWEAWKISRGEGKKAENKPALLSLRSAQKVAVRLRCVVKDDAIAERLALLNRAAFGAFAIGRDEGIGTELVIVDAVAYHAEGDFDDPVATATTAFLCPR